ncbi:DUF302 domain-containing protein [Pontiella sulfatireligans]|uniref:DUF302 domain-containing protein n=1 Tax=Pontiella sulfatireligans TaxID=2750658 RepID=A0A6C2UQL1_9BACT|nr:DUF302 domain-containing protein [Pontiella sulfatireligans]VGO22233.1 hypothetical protein SCARR_04315 [Pontiella sulfatireligans]
MKKIGIGIFAGAMLLGIILFTAMPKMMLIEKASPYGHDETVQRIESAVTNGGWEISRTMNMQKSLAKLGQEIGRVTVVKICEPNHAAAILTDDDAMFVAVMMPCSIAVYDKTDGKTYVSTMNAGMMGRMFGGTVAEVMAGPVAREAAAFTAFLE